MSGGSLGYLFCKDVERLFNPDTINYILDAEKYLLENGAVDVAKDVRRLIEYIYSARNRVEVLHENLSDVFKAVEWHLSGDYGKESVAKAIEKYRNG